jgi:hypothetical protein
MFLRSLESAKGIKWPKRVEGDLDIPKIKSIIGLRLPKVQGAVMLIGLPVFQGKILKFLYPRLNIGTIQHLKKLNFDILAERLAPKD